MPSVVASAAAADTLAIHAKRAASATTFSQAEKTVIVRLLVAMDCVSRAW